MAMRTHWINARGITQCSMTKATPEASGCCHQATSTLRITLAAGRATINKTMMKNSHTLLAILVAIAMQRYDAVCITL